MNDKDYKQLAKIENKMQRVKDLQKRIIELMEELIWKEIVKEIN